MQITQFNWLKWIQFQKQITAYNAIYKLLSTRENLIFTEEEQSQSVSEVTACRDWTKAKLIATRSSEEERRVDALALRADERRDKLR